MSWFAIVRIGLQLLNTLVQWANRKSMISIGEQKEIARQTADFLRSAGITDEIIAQVVTMTPDELDRVLEDRFID